MNIYTYFHNNVVDFNNAINSRWPQSEDRVTDGNEGNLPTGKDELSTLPPEILNEMMTHLPLESVQALSLTNHKIRPTTEPVIKFMTNILVQQLFETFNIEAFHIRKRFTPEKREIFKADVETAKTLKTGSDERIQALRDAICTLYQGMITLETFLCPFSSLTIFRDKPLIVQMMKSLKFNRCPFIYHYDKIAGWFNEKIHQYGINNELIFLDLLKNNQIDLKELDIDIDIFNVTVPQELIEALVGALAENQSISKVSVSWQDCDLVQLDAILESIKNNQHILKFQIRDIGANRNCTGKEWGFQKTAKEKSYKEFEDLVKNKLNTTFQFLKRDNCGQFCFQRL